MKKLSKRLSIPLIGLGTFEMNQKESIAVFKKAYELGYRHFDTATFYETEPLLGEALKTYKRESYKITTKLWTEDMGYYSALKAFDRSLNELKTPYVDYYLIHWPFPKNCIEESLTAIHELCHQGLISHYGVSNFMIAHLEQIKKAGFKVSLNQIEYHPYLKQKDLFQYCQKEGIEVIAYCPLARTDALNERVLQKIALKKKKTVAQVILRWLVQKEIIAIPKASTIEHLKENLEALEFELTNEEMRGIDEIKHEERIVTPDCADFDCDKKNTLK